MKFWKKLFQRKENIKDLFFSFNPEGTSWRAVHWNADLKVSTHRSLTLEIKGLGENLIRWEDRQTEKDIQFFRDGKLTKLVLDQESLKEASDLMNIALHSVLKHGLENDRPFMLEPVSGVTTMDFQNETRALQWIEASFKTLYRALENFKTQKDLILTASVFSGIVPDNQERVLRVMVFNLDIFYYQQEDKSLRIVIFDDKNQGHGSSKSPTFHQIIKVTKPQFYDEIGKLVHRIAKIGEVR